jgi:hypothetical protein
LGVVVVSLQYPASPPLIETMTVIVGESPAQSTGQSDQISFDDIFSGRQSFTGRDSP